MQKNIMTVVLALLACAGLTGCADEAPKEIRKPMTKGTNQLELATFGGGCFWCLEAVFEMLPGVESVTSGYTGGRDENVTYEQVCSGKTGHAEVVQIAYDPKQIAYEKLLETFWEVHDPTTLNRQGNDIGTQYRSAIFYHSDAQKLAAEKSMAAEQANWPSPIVTEIVPLTKFISGEGYHQDYYRNNPNQGYCRMVIRPKVEKFEKKLKREE